MSEGVRRALVAARDAQDRLLAAFPDSERGSIAAVEAIMWTAAVVEVHGKLTDPRLKAVRYVRNRVLHQLTAPLALGVIDDYPTDEVLDVVLGRHAFVLVERLPPSDPDHPDPEGERSYSMYLAGKGVADVLDRSIGLFEVPDARRRRCGACGALFLLPPNTRLERGAMMPRNGTVLVVPVSSDGAPWEGRPIHECFDGRVLDWQ